MARPHKGDLTTPLAAGSPKPPRKPKPVVQLPSTGWVTVSRVALTTPMSLVLPIGGGALTDLEGPGAHLLGLGVPGLGADDHGLRTGLRRCRRLGRSPSGTAPKTGEADALDTDRRARHLGHLPEGPGHVGGPEPGRDRAGRAGEAAPASPEAAAAGTEPAPLDATALDRGGDGDEGGVDLASRAFGAGGRNAGPHGDVPVGKGHGGRDGRLGRELDGGLPARALDLQIMAEDAGDVP